MISPIFGPDYFINTNQTAGLQNFGLAHYKYHGNNSSFTMNDF